jgi:L-aspartate oxidase
MVRVLMAQANRQKRIHRMDFHFTVDLVVEDGRCCGAVVLDEHSESNSFCPPKQSCSQRAGRAKFMRERRIHPMRLVTVWRWRFAQGRSCRTWSSSSFIRRRCIFRQARRSSLGSDARRRGQLRNHKGEAFMQRYHPLGALAPRDIVARAIWAEMAATKARHVYLDVTHLGADFVKRRFPTIYSTCLRYDIDITEEWIPVSPSAHYMMGGVWTDLNGATTLPGLFAAGEVACSGVHGANRLASNSLLEGLVFGMRAGVTAVAWAARQTMPDLSGQVAALKHGPRHRLDDTEKMRNSLRRTMWGQVGIIRSRESLVRAIAQLSRWEHMVSKPFAARSDLEVKNMVQVAHCVAEAALWRENSVGAHFRSDIPESKRPGWKQHSQLSVKEPAIGRERQKNSGLVVALRPPKTQSRGRSRQDLV